MQYLKSILTLATAGLLATSSFAQTTAAPATPAKKATKAKAPSAKASSFTAAQRKQAEANRATKLAPLPETTPEQLEASKRVILGRYECEFKQALLIERNDANPGYMNVQFGKKVYIAKPVASSTGVVRLEDVNGEGLVLQVVYKSMLMNAKTGQRVADECIHEVQRALLEQDKKDAEAAKAAPDTKMTTTPPELQTK